MDMIRCCGMGERLATSPPTAPTRDASGMPAVRRTDFLLITNKIFRPTVGN